MFELNEEQVDLNDPEVQENIEAAREAFATFARVAQMANISPREEDVNDILNELYAKNGDIYDPVDWNFAWQRERGRRKEAERREAELVAKEEARRQEIELYKRPSSEDLPGLLEKNRQRLPQAQPRPAPDDLSHLSAEEFDNLPDDELRRRLGADVRVEDRQTRTSGLSATEIRNNMILAGAIVNQAGIRKVKSVKLSQEELTAREERARIIAQDKAERRKLEQAWRKK